MMKQLPEVFNAVIQPLFMPEADELFDLGPGLFMINTRSHGDHEDNFIWVTGAFHYYGRGSKNPDDNDPDAVWFMPTLVPGQPLFRWEPDDTWDFTTKVSAFIDINYFKRTES